MTDINAEIESLKKEIEECDSDLLLLYSELGKVAFLYSKTIVSSESDSVFDDVMSLSCSKDELDSEILLLDSALEKKVESGKEISETESVIKKLTEDFETMLSALGAVAVEVYSSGGFPEDLEIFKKYIEKIKTLEQKTNQIEKTSFFRSIKIKGYQSNLSEIYQEIGQYFYTNRVFSVIPGEQALKIYSSLDDLVDEREKVTELLQQKQEAMAEVISSLDKFGGMADASKTKKVLEQKRQKTEKSLKEKYLEYGQIIIKSVDKWLDEFAPQDLKDVCARIEAKQAKRERLILNLSFCDDKKQINFNQAQIDRLVNQLELLNRQKEMLDRQINDLNEKLEKKKSENDELRQHQEETSYQASLLVDKVQ